MGALLLAAVVIAAGMTWALHRDIKRAIERRKARARYQAALRRLASATNAMKATIGLALLPALSEAVKTAADFERSMRKFQPAMDAPRAALTTDPSEGESRGE